MRPLERSPTAGVIQLEIQIYGTTEKLSTGEPSN